MIQRKRFLKEERKELSSCPGYTPSSKGYTTNKEPGSWRARGWVGYSTNTRGAEDELFSCPGQMQG